ncbi:hypothetical protein M422DRAFT_267854 [Sphaerobolus stellatus SS14]|uniref:F-box domain-containing protein n=1 Tax=Sphaerobolus stellatus (strain SS14) TaxID=990650 RepID=A0A0C9UMK9_SPHS4|nr:hypothetical protein M422DRAFT_268409 [Sphaerobolus stellatus SS14]KIJ30603.1 hypothetical protein M422DRAFT_267854 [Sphaerobolus stellatus SS14]
MPPKGLRLPLNENTKSTIGSSSAPGASSSQGNTLPILFKLPNEIIHEILSYFPDMDLPKINRGDIYLLYDPSIETSGYIREDALRALSQTCHTLREFFLPLLWEHFDVYARGGGMIWYKRVSNTLTRGSVFLKDPRNQIIASHVRSCRVVLTRCATNIALPAFAKCLASLPNLHTLDILHAHSQMTTHLKEGFKRGNFPAIKKIILPSCAHNVLRCCPEVTSVTCIEENGSKLIGAIASSCPKVEVLERFSPDINMAKRIVNKVSNLKRITLHMHDRITQIVTALKPLKHLCEIDFLHPTPLGPDLTFLSSAEIASSPAIKAAKEVLKGPPERRKLGIIYHWYERDGVVSERIGWYCEDLSWHEKRISVPLY